MPLYRRTYTKSAVQNLIYQSECRRLEPHRPPGHTVSLHADMRQDITDHRQGRIIHLACTVEAGAKMDSTQTFSPLPAHSVPSTDSRFASRKDLILAVHQGLNSSVGQLKLGEFDADPSKNRVTFKANLAPPTQNIERYRNQTGVHEVGLSANGVFLVIDRLPDGEIHLQTAYPTDVI
ncbi:MAG: hypothetical protein KDB03_16000 [Planctomycetales bacterium]|nr:hypothetical protein [Planctomycetales bacterium]